MSEKRFYITDTGLGLDTVSDEMYSFGDEEDFCKLFDKLNEQQDTITEQEEHIKLLTKTIERMIKKINKIYELSASERSV